MTHHIRLPLTNDQYQELRQLWIESGAAVKGESWTRWLLARLIKS